MTYACQMCGQTYEAAGTFGAGGSSTCPKCGTAAGVDRAAIEGKVKGPAIALMIVGGLSLLGGFFSAAIAAIALVVEPQPGTAPEDAVIGAVLYDFSALSSFVVGGVIIGGALKMYRLESWGFALAASILSVIPCVVCLLYGLPIGIWSLVVLNDPNVKAAFRSPQSTGLDASRPG